MAFISLGTKTLNLKVPGVIVVNGIGQQGFSSSAGQTTRWSFNLFIDGDLVLNPGGDGPQDCVPLGGTKFCQAGNRVVELRWIADPTVTLYKAYFVALGLPNAMGQ